MGDWIKIHLSVEIVKRASLVVCWVVEGGAEEAPQHL